MQVERTDGSGQWEILRAPPATSLELPTLPPTVLAVAPADIGRVEVRIEGQLAVNGYAASLRGWQHHRVFFGSTDQHPPGRISRGVLRLP